MWMCLQLGVTEMDLGPDLIHNQQLEATVSWNSSLPRQLEQQQQLEQQREQLWNQILAAWPNEEGFREVQLETIQIRHDEGVDTTHPWGLMPGTPKLISNKFPGLKVHISKCSKGWSGGLVQCACPGLAS